MSYKILTYTDFQLNAVEKKYKKILSFFENGEVKSAEVKKMPETGYFRAKIRSRSAAPVQIHPVPRARLTCSCLKSSRITTTISRVFCGGAEIDESRLADLVSAEKLPAQEVEGLGI